MFKLHRNQTSGFFLSGQFLPSLGQQGSRALTHCSFSAKTPCPICSLPISHPAHGLALLFLCRHVVHAHCVDHGEELPQQPDPTLVGLGIGGQPGLSGKIALYVLTLLLPFVCLMAYRVICSTAILRAKITQGCPVCHKRSEGDRT